MKYTLKKVIHALYLVLLSFTLAKQMLIEDKTFF